jgi:1-aminocyclopropane-1-carboxylate deaminase
LIRDRLVHLKRDDQLRLPGSQISGNKARKMLALNSLKNFPQCVVSHGGPQSNAMVSIAAVVHFQNQDLKENDPTRKRFVYYTKNLPRFLKNQPSGNLFRATALGMELVEVTPQEYNQIFGGDNSSGGPPRAPPGLEPPVPGNSLFVPQGGAFEGALAGTRLLGQEIVDFWTNDRPLAVCIPGGTCSTAALLHRAILQAKKPSQDIQVVVIPCVGDQGYAMRQMMSLTSHMSPDYGIPKVLSPGRQADYFRFGEPHIRILETWRELQDEHQVDVDLLYGAPSWSILFRHWRTVSDPECAIAGRQIMYVNTGGLEGISTQLLRYKHKELVNDDEIQLPGRTKPK